MHLGQVFSFEALSLDGLNGRLVLTASILSTLLFCCKFLLKKDFLVIIVEKNKKVMDFVITAYLIHFFACFLYNFSFPEFKWILYNGAIASFTICLGEIVVRKYEQNQFFQFARILDTEPIS